MKKDRELPFGLYLFASQIARLFLIPFYTTFDMNMPGNGIGHKSYTQCILNRAGARKTHHPSLWRNMKGNHND
jgi:hypothetical protein